MDLKLAGQCTGGLSCDGGCCRHTIMDAGVVIKQTYCEHYEKTTGNCKIYDIRDAMGFTGCPTFPTLEYALENGLPKNCGYRLEQV